MGLLLSIFRKSASQFKDSPSSYDDDSDIEDNFESFKNPEDYDFILYCENQTFPVHERILSARSDILKLLIKEGDTKNILIENITAQALKNILHYMYTGKVPDLMIEAMVEVYDAADKYLLEGLKRKLAILIKKQLNTSNVCDVLVNAGKFKATYVKDLAVTYLLANEYFLKSKNWQTFAEKYPELAEEVNKKYIERH